MMFKVSFDNHGSDPASVEVIPIDRGGELWIDTGNDRIKVLTTWRDQWGVFIDLDQQFALTIAQEDKTRSFLDAMSQAFQYLRTQCEAGTLPGEVNV